MDLNCLSVSGISAVRTTMVSAMIEKPQESPTESWKNTSTPSNTSISGWTGLAIGRMFIGSGRGGGTGAGPPRDPSRRGWTGCSAAHATPPAPDPAVCRSRGSPGRRTPSTSARTCSAAAAPARSRAGRRRSAQGRAGASRPVAFAAGRRLLDELGQRAANALEAVARGQLAHLGPRHHDDVLVGRQAVGQRHESLSEQALHLVAIDRAAHLARHRDAQTGAVGGLPRGRAREAVEDEEAVADRPTLAIDALELRAARKAPALRAPADGARQAVHRGQTVSRLRPLSRRRLSVRRPARVLMRARNPWVRARLRFLG